MNHSDYGTIGYIRCGNRPETRSARCSVLYLSDTWCRCCSFGKCDYWRARRSRERVAHADGVTGCRSRNLPSRPGNRGCETGNKRNRRSEEHTSELQSRGHLVCRLLLEKKKKTT